MHPNKFFDKIFCINLDRRPDRWEASLREFEKHRLTVERFPAVDGRALKIKTRLLPGEVGVVLSHKELLQHAKAQGYQKILILEDDIEFSDTFTQDWDNWSNEIPHYWEMLYLGGNLVGWSPEKVTRHVFKGKHLYAIHALGLTARTFDYWLGHINNDEQIDLTYAKHSVNFDAFLMVPRMAFQRDDFSDIQNEPSRYGFLKYGQYPEVMGR